MAEGVYPGGDSTTMALELLDGGARAGRAVHLAAVSAIG